MEYSQHLRHLRNLGGRGRRLPALQGALHHRPRPANGRARRLDRHVAVPSAQARLHISVADRQWVFTPYTLAFGGLLLLGGRITDFAGRKRVFEISLVGFAAASAPGAAQDAPMLFGPVPFRGPSPRSWRLPRSRSSRRPSPTRRNRSVPSGLRRRLRRHDVHRPDHGRHADPVDVVAVDVAG